MVAPGPIYTKMMAELPGMGPDAFLDYYGKDTPSEGSLGTVEDIALTVGFLAESATKWINGEIIMVNGGYIMA